MRSDPLYQLIASLTASEKRYFRLQREPGSTQLALFQAILATPRCTDETLLAQHPGESFAQHLAASKHKLRKGLLKSLRHFHEEKQFASELRMRMEECQLLIDRRLWLQALKLVGASLKKAAQYELFPPMVELLDMKLRLASENLLPKARQTVQEIIQQKEEILELIRVETQLNAWYREMRFRYLSSPDLSAPEMRDWVSDLLAEALMGKPAPTFRGEIYRLSTLCNLHFSLREMSQSLEFARQAHHCYTTRPHFRKADPILYLSLMLNLLNAALYEGQQAEFLHFLDEIKAEMPRLRGDLFPYERRANYLELFYCLNFSNESRGRSLIQSLVPWLEAHAEDIPPPSQLSFRYNFAAFYFLHAGYKEALHHTQEILNHCSIEHRKDIQVAAVVYQLVIHYQLGNYDVLEYLLRSFYRSLDARSGHSAYQRWVYRLFRELAQTGDALGGDAIFRAAGEDLERVLEKVEGKLPTGSQELSFWLQGRGVGRSVREVYREALRRDGRLEEG